MRDIAARGVVLGETVRGEDVREARVGRRRVRVVGTLLPIGRGIRELIGIEIVGEVRFERLVVRGQRSVFQSRGDVEPADAVGMHDERRVAGERFVAAFVGIALRSRAASSS